MTPHLQIPLLDPGARCGYEFRDGLWQPRVSFPVQTAPVPNPQTVSPWVWNTYYNYNSGLTPIPAQPNRPAPEPRERAEPFVGYKTLKIKIKKGQMYLRGGGRVNYSIDVTAACLYHPDHTPPAWNCSCGFYALKEQPTQPDHGMFRAQVELFGTVIAASHGWRASRQRVLSMETFRACQAGKSNYDECGKKAAGFSISKRGNVWPICAKHAVATPITLADLTALLGTEVKWVA